MTNINHSQVAVFVKSLLNDRCSNYGYDYRDFKRVSSQRSKARKELEYFFYYNPATVLERIEQESRIQLESVNGESRLSYNVGQSGNEEVTNLMRRLVNPKAKWVK